MTPEQLEKLCTYLEENDASMEAQREAATELRRLHAINLELFRALGDMVAMTDPGVLTMLFGEALAIRALEALNKTMDATT